MTRIDWILLLPLIWTLGVVAWALLSPEGSMATDGNGNGALIMALLVTTFFIGPLSLICLIGVIVRAVMRMGGG